MGSLVAGSEHLVRVFFLNGSRRTVGFDRCGVLGYSVAE